MKTRNVVIDHTTRGWAGYCVKHGCGIDTGCCRQGCGRGQQICAAWSTDLCRDSRPRQTVVCCGSSRAVSRATHGFTCRYALTSEAHKDVRLKVNDADAYIRSVFARPCVYLVGKGCAACEDEFQLGKKSVCANRKSGLGSPGRPVPCGGLITEDLALRWLMCGGRHRINKMQLPLTRLVGYGKHSLKLGVFY